MRKIFTFNLKLIIKNNYFLKNVLIILMYKFFNFNIFIIIFYLKKTKLLYI